MNCKNDSKIENYKLNPLTCEGCEYFSEDGFADICWECRRNGEIPDMYTEKKKALKAKIEKAKENVK